MQRIYMVEDEKNLNNLLTRYLEAAGYAVTAFTDGIQALERAGDDPDLWILDIMVPGADGFQLIKAIRSVHPDIPVLFMSARNAELDRVIGLEMGSDDYLPKPFLPRELVLRAQKLLQRSRPVPTAERPPEQLGTYSIHFDSRIATVNGENLNLTVKEYEMLAYLLENTGKALTRAQMIDAIWGADYFGSERVVDDTLRRLRKKMPDLIIEAVYGYGYRFRKE